MSSNDKNYTVYKLTSPSGRVYIGCTRQKPEDRWDNGSKYHHNEALSSDIKKFGWDNFKHEIMQSELEAAEAYQLERDLIHKYDSCNSEYGYNKTHGGKINPGIIRSDDYRKQLSDRVSGENHPLYGKKLSEEHRKKISEANMGHSVSEETKAKIGSANTGRNKSEETIQKWRESYTGYTHSETTRRKIGDANRNKIVSEETRRKISESNRGRVVSEESRKRMSDNSGRKHKVLCVNTGVIYDSIRAAATDVNTPASNMWSVCSGKTKTAGGYVWRYI